MDNEGCEGCAVVHACHTRGMPESQDAPVEAQERPDVALALGVLYANLSDDELEDLMRFVTEHTPGQRDQVLRAFRNALMHKLDTPDFSEVVSLRLPLHMWSFPPEALSPIRETALAAGSLAKYVVIETPDGNTTAMVRDVVAALNDATANQRQAAAKVRAALVPEGRLAVSPPLIEQVRRNAEAQAELADEFGMLTATQVHAISGSSAQNTSARASRLRTEGRIFCIDADGATLFPGFQFDDRGRPREVIAQVIAAFGSKLRGWELALWFTSANVWLGDARPVDKLEDAPDEVVQAAARLAQEILAA